MRKRLPNRVPLALCILFFVLHQAAGQNPDPILTGLPNWSFDPGKVKLRQPLPPDTLLLGDYVIVVERYDTVGAYSRINRTFSDLKGIGRVLFNCQSRVLPPFWPGGLVLQGQHLPLSTVKFQVVDSVANPLKEISFQEARVFDKQIERGAALSLSLPVSGSALETRNMVSELVQQLRPNRPEGVRFQFDAQQVRLVAGRKGVGQVLSGKAVFPAKPSVPIPPFALDIEGFRLEVQKMVIYHDRPAEATARLLLPDLISSGTGCDRVALDLGRINLSQKCEFYVDEPLARYGPLGIGNTTLEASGKGFIADFSSTIGTAPSGGSATWKGLVLRSGNTAASPTRSVYSNTGYLQAGYSYGIASVTKNGFSGELNTGGAYAYFSVQPFGYALDFSFAALTLQNNHVKSGIINNCNITLPVEAVLDRNGQPITVFSKGLDIGSDYGAMGQVFDDNFFNREFFWGDFTQKNNEIMAYGVGNCRAGAAFFPGQYRRDYYPVAGDAFAEPPPNFTTAADIKGIGMTGVMVYHPSKLFIQSPDIPTPHRTFPLGSNVLEYILKGREASWFNVQSQGLHAALYSSFLGQEPQKLGDTNSPYYVGGDPFLFGQYISKGRSEGSIEMQFVESAVFKSDVTGGVKLPQPTASNLLIREICFTSTAHIAGGKVDLSEPAELDYWGLQLVPRPGFESAGVLSVKTGQIILTGAGLAEKRHFKEPFNLTWGEMLANGSLGRLFFDYHTAGQQFDGFNFSPESVALSDYSGSSPPYGFLRVGGIAHFPFFGGNYLHILDHYDPGQALAPFNKRYIKLETNAFGVGFLPSDLSVYGNWSDGLGVFDISSLNYNDAIQNGFLGDGTAALQMLAGGLLTSLLTMQNGDACISLIPETQVREVDFGIIGDITNMTEIWGCICIKDDYISDIVFGGSVTNSANLLMVAARAGQTMSVVAHITPSTYELTFDGTASLSLMLSVDMVVSGHLSLKFDTGNQFMEGEVDAYFHAGAGLILVGGSLSGQGQANWHIGLNPFDNSAYQSIQGSISLSVLGVAVSVSPTFPFIHSVGAGTGLNAGFYLGNNAPKSEAWILLGGNPRYQLNMAALPDRLSGVYGYVQIKQDVNLGILSGGYEIFVGLGAFTLDVAQAVGLGGLGIPGSPYAIGHLGGRIHGEFLGGLVGGAAWIDLQLIGPVPFSFEGTIGVEGCVLWVACTTYHFTVGVNTAEGFYVKS